MQLLIQLMQLFLSPRHGWRHALVLLQTLNVCPFGFILHKHCDGRWILVAELWIQSTSVDCVPLVHAVRATEDDTGAFLAEAPMLVRTSGGDGLVVLDMFDRVVWVLELEVVFCDANESHEGAT